MTIDALMKQALKQDASDLIPGMIETGHKFGMIALDRALANLVEAGTVAEEAALAKAVDAEKLARLIGRPQSQAAPAPVQTAAPRADRPLQTTAGAAKP